MTLQLNDYERRVVKAALERLSSEQHAIAAIYGKGDHAPYTRAARTADRILARLKA